MSPLHIHHQWCNSLRHRQYQTLFDKDNLRDAFMVCIYFFRCKLCTCLLLWTVLIDVIVTIVYEKP